MLMIACLNRDSTDVAKALIKHGADINYLRHGSGWEEAFYDCALQTAAFNYREDTSKDMVELLITNGGGCWPVH